MLTIEEAKEEVKGYKGISIHGKAIRLSFMYLGKRYLETLKNVSLTKNNIKAAFQKRIVICHAIEFGKFDYSSIFPNSKTALALISSGVGDQAIPLNVFLDKFLADSKVNNRPMTHQHNTCRTDKYIRPALGVRCMTKIKVSDIKQLINTNLVHLSNKTICEVLTPLRAAFRYAIEDELLTVNPMLLVKNPKKEHTDNADPFTQKEISKILETNTKRLIERDALAFACWTGLRPSELLAISRCDVDLENRKLYVKRSVVKGIFASTKTDGSDRCIDLLDDAFEIISNLIQRTEHLRTFKVKVLQSNNRLVDERSLQFIFTSSKSKDYWSDSSTFNKMFVKPHCQASGVRYRGIGQARHTYGSQLVTAGVNLNWIAKQMGHSTIKMLEKHYGRWMESEVPDMAAQVSRKLKQKTFNDPREIQTKKELK
jgi:integrase